MAFSASVPKAPMSEVSRYYALRPRAVRCSVPHPTRSSPGRNLGSEVRDHSVEQGETASRHSEAAVIRCLDGPLVAQNGNPFWIERTTGQHAVTRGIDSFDKPQAHQQIFVGSLTRCELFFDGESAAAVFHAHEPGFRPSL